MSPVHAPFLHAAFAVPEAAEAANGAQEDELQGPCLTAGWSPAAQGVMDDSKTATCAADRTSSAAGLPCYHTKWTLRAPDLVRAVTAESREC